MSLSGTHQTTRRGHLCGSCGPSVNPTGGKEEHICTRHYYPAVLDGDGDEPHLGLEKAIDSEVGGGYVSLAIAKSLHEELPDVPIDSWVTCNRFRIEECEDAWKEYVLLFRELLEAEGMFVLGFGSDGDARRANVQLAMMSVELNKNLKTANLLRYDDVHAMFEFAPTVRGWNTDNPDREGDHPPENLHNQDTVSSTPTAPLQCWGGGGRDGRGGWRQ